ncbi:hypothetical protein DPQ22_04800 [Candidatus Tokpelaia sp.]|nr:hypothetical protein DPQ22_04800 [Candidatus Tokpelaia sp.]
MQPDKLHTPRPAVFARRHNRHKHCRSDKALPLTIPAVRKATAKSTYRKLPLLGKRIKRPGERGKRGLSRLDKGSLISAPLIQKVFLHSALQAALAAQFLKKTLFF